MEDKSNVRNHQLLLPSLESSIVQFLVAEVWRERLQLLHSILKKVMCPGLGFRV
jgi:hypothetical protein